MTLESPPKIAMIGIGYEPTLHPLGRDMLQALDDAGFQTAILTTTRTPLVRRGLKRREEWDGRCRVVRVPSWYSTSSNALSRFLTYVSFALSSAVHAQMLSSCSGLIVYGSPATNAIPALVARKVWGVPFVFYAQDLWPDSVVDSGMIRGSLLRNITSTSIDRFMACVYERSSAVVAISPAASQVLQARMTNPEKVHLIYNWVDESVFQPLPPVEHGHFEILYVGTMGHAQDLATAVEAMGLLKDYEISLRLVGSGAQKDNLRALAQRLGLSNVHFHDAVTPAEARLLMQGADLHLVSLRDESAFRTAIPSKLQALLASRLPLLIAATGSSAQLVERHHAGLVVAPGNPRALAQAIVHAYEMGPGERSAMATRGRNLYLSEMSAENGRKSLVRVVQEMLSPGYASRRSD